MNGRLKEIGKFCGMEMNGEKRKVMDISRQPSTVQITIDQKQPENVECSNCLGSVITRHARCTRGIKSKIALPKAALNKKKPFSPTNWNYCIQSFGLFLGL